MCMDHVINVHSQEKTHVVLLFPSQFQNDGYDVDQNDHIHLQRTAASRQFMRIYIPTCKQWDIRLECIVVG